MFGYATNETPELMPLTYELARKLAARLRFARYAPKDSADYLWWVRPDAKTQVSVEYNETTDANGRGKLTPIRVHSIGISAQHDPGVTQEQIEKDLKEKIIDKVVDAKWLDQHTVYHLNPSKKFVVGGPQGDAGVTGRKIIVDTYGGWGAHGGGAFSGKDPTKVDRSAAYAARWVAKSLVAAGLADRVLVQVAYMIGVSEPMSIYVTSYNTAKEGWNDERLLAAIKKNFRLTPYWIIHDLDLRRPIYYRTARFGHFGRKDGPDEKIKGFTWEEPKVLDLTGI